LATKKQNYDKAIPNAADVKVGDGADFEVGGIYRWKADPDYQNDDVLILSEEGQFVSLISGESFKDDAEVRTELERLPPDSKVTLTVG